jgi:carboxypeptidase Q
MKQSRFYVVTLPVLMAILSFAQNPTPDMVPMFKQINMEVDNHSKAFQSLNLAASTIGHRLTGSANGHKAEDLAIKLLRSYGYGNSRFHNFSVEAWSRDTVSLQIAPDNSDDFRSVQVTALASTPVESHLQGKIIDLGNGLEENFANMASQVIGKVVLMNIGLVGMPKETKNLHRSEKTALAIKYGATGVIMVKCTTYRYGICYRQTY